MCSTYRAILQCLLPQLTNVRPSLYSGSDFSLQMSRFMTLLNIIKQKQDLQAMSTRSYFIKQAFQVEFKSPVSQSAPVKAAGQTQVKLATWSTHSPPFRHGCDSHSSMSGGSTEKRRLSAGDSVSRSDFSVFVWKSERLQSKTLSRIKSTELPFWKHRVSLTRCLVLKVIPSHVDTRIHELCRAW